VVRRLATTDHPSANALLEGLEDTDPAMASRVVAQLEGQE
jgi:hypothetical protein